MRSAAAIFVLLCVAGFAQESAPIPNSQVPQRKEILRNHHVTVSLLELAPGEAAPMHQHDRDLLAVFVGGVKTRSVVFGHRPVADKMAVGEVRFVNAGYSHTFKNLGTEPFRVVDVEFGRAFYEFVMAGVVNDFVA